MALNAELLGLGTQAFQHILQLCGRLGTRRIRPDADILNDRSLLRLSQIRRAGQQRQLAIGTQIEALEKAETEGVISGEIIHALLLKHQQPVEPLRVELGGNLRNARRIFSPFKMQCHIRSPFSCYLAGFPPTRE